MSTKTTIRVRDAAIRAAGAVLLLLCWASVHWLFKTAGLQHAPVSVLGYAAAAGAFVCFSLGSILLALGVHIHDEVEVSARWANRPGNLGLVSRSPDPAPFRLVSEREFTRAATASLDDLMARRRDQRLPANERRHGW